MRKRQREHKHRALLAYGYEAKGKTLMERFAHLEAAEQFERALADAETPADEVRLCLEIGYALGYGPRPASATAWFERAAHTCAAEESLRAELPRVQGHLPPYLFSELRTKEALACCVRTRDLAMDAGDVDRILHANTALADVLIRFQRYGEAEEYIAGDALSHGVDANYINSNRHLCLGKIRAAEGDANAAFAEFERCIAIARDLQLAEAKISYWADYANSAMALGFLDVARMCFERRLFLARERRITRIISSASLQFAQMLITIGEYEQARSLVRDALTYDASTPQIQMMLASVGTEIATILDDGTLYDRVFDEEILKRTFSSGVPEYVAQIVFAYAKAWIVQGRVRRAAALLSRSLQTIAHADHAWGVLALSARYCSPKDSTRARTLLLERLRLPNHTVAQAYLLLFDAYAAQRHRDNTQAREHAAEAAARFAKLGWKHQQAEALAITGLSYKAARRHMGEEKKELLHQLHPELTKRERQVAELVLQGLTNRTIARMLSISEHTVETHMTSILSRLGLRSRWQLIEQASL